MTDDQIKIVAAVAASSAAIIVALTTLFFGRVFAGRDRRRQMYGESFRAALEWEELLYRVRRRDDTPEALRAIHDRFHDLQERLVYYDGWIGSESKYMRRSYRKLVDKQKHATRSLIQAAWDKPGKLGNADADDVNPQIAVSASAADDFLRDVRNHLSLQPWRWALVLIRNCES
ncbi:hypothetical protein [Umezawaea sp. NPDC059074]|uniref:hypothetical protein n=1 Tax=Umezawaea sp. NPDC059074 TaxID=3346716 RepID=UPI0036B5FBDC